MQRQTIFRLGFKVVALNLTIALLLSAPFPLYAAANQLPPVDQPPDPNACELYPIALSAASLADVHVGDAVSDIFNGTQTGNFGWLSWTGNPSNTALVTSLTPPGDSSTYINPDDPADTTVSLGDWIQGRPGVSNSKNVREALDALSALDIAIPIWDSIRGSGNSSAYRVVAFARVRLMDYVLSNENYISARFLGYTCEGAVIELDKNADSTTLISSLGLDLGVSQSEALPFDDLTYTTTVTNTGTALTLSGRFVIENFSDVVATVAYYDDFIEHQLAANDEWVPLAGTAASLPGYTPVSPAPLTIGMTLEAEGMPASGVVYPTEGDGIVGTLLNPGGVAIWEYQATVPLSREQANLLLDSGLVLDIRNTIHFEVTPRLPDQGQPFVDQVSFIDQLRVQSGDLTNVVITLTLPDGQEITYDQWTISSLAVLIPGASASVETTYQIPTLAQKGTDETDEAYLVRLVEADGVLLTATADATADSNGSLVSAPQGTASSIQHVPIVTLSKSGPETVEPGATVIYDLALNNIGSAGTRELAMEDMLPGNDLGTITDTPEGLDPGASAMAYASHVVPMAQPPGELTDVASVLWEDANDNVYGPLTDSFTTEVLSLVPDGLLTLAPAFSGPNVINTQQTLVATLKDTNEVPLPGVTIHFTVIGPNAMTDEVITAADGTAAFTYTGTNNGFDSVQATADLAGTAVESNIATVHWIIPLQSVTTSTIWGRFFESDNRGRFNTPPTEVPVFSQAFPSINFNPPAGTVPGNTSGVGVWTRPFINVTMDLNGIFAGTITAQGDSHRAGLGTLFDFSAVFTGEFTARAAGNVTYDFFSDDGFIFGIGNGAQRVGGANSNPPPSGLTPFESYPVMGAFNRPTPPVRNSVTVYFPEPGVYPFEIDYNECCGGSLALTLAVRETGFGVTPLGALVISPNSGQTRLTGQQQTFTVTAQDASGLPLTDMTVMLRVSGANTQELTAVTDASGVATFTYTGNNVGGDTVQAIAWAQGNVSAYSAEVGVIWQRGVPPPTDPGTPLAVPGWIGSPANQSTLTGQVPIGLRSGVTLADGTLDYWPSDNPDAAAVLATGLSGTGTLASLDTTLLANGSYIIRLQGTDTSDNQVNSGIMVTVEGEYKPGRVRFTIVDLTVPVTGLPITIGRTYDSLERNLQGDFGYGWSLAIGNPRVEVNQAHDVTITMPDGRRVTFYFTPYAPSPWFGFLLVPDYTPEAGVYGDLTANGCDLLTVSAGKVFCFPGGLYNATEFTYTDPYGRVYVMESSGVLRSITDLNGNTLTFSDSGITSSAAGLNIPFERDGEGRITQITDPEGNAYHYSYDAAGDLAEVHLPGIGDPIHYSYNADHNFHSGVDPRGNPALIATYDADGRLQSQTDALGNTTNYAYDLLTRTTQITNPDGGTQSFVENRFGDLLSQTNPLGESWTYVYDAERNLLSETNPLGETTSFTYDANGNRTSMTDPLGNMQVSVTYNAFGGPLSLTDGLGNRWDFTYDATSRPTDGSDTLGSLGGYTWNVQGNPLTIRNGNGETLSLSYDAFGNVIGLADPLGNVTGYTYDPMGRRLAETNPLAETIRFAYDALGRMTASTDALGNTTSFEYDANGNPTAQIDPLGRRTSYGYDAGNRMIEITFSDGSNRTFNYDFRGNLLTEINETDHVTSYTYDLAGQLMNITRATGTPTESTTSFEYDSAGRRSLTIDQRGNTTSFAYDSAGRLDSIIDAEGGVTSYDYDEVGRLIRVTDANGNQMQFGYDARGRLIETTFPDGTATSQAFDLAGRVMQSIDQGGRVTRYEYDVAGQLIRIIRAVGTADETTFTYVYDAAGRRTSSLDPLGHVTTFVFDSAGRLVRTTDPLGSATVHTYDDAGQLVSSTDPNGHRSQFAYDDRNRLTVTTLPDGTTQVNTYDAVGRLISTTDQNGNVTTYGYDELGRLIAVTDPLGNTTTYTYDPAGNMLTIRAANGHVTSFEYDALNRQELKTWPDGTLESFVYDPLGNLLSHGLADSNTNTFAYDALNRLIRADYFDGQNVEYAYSETGMRSSVTDARGTSAYVYDSLDRMAHVTTPGGQVVFYNNDAAGNRTSMTSPAGLVGYSYDDANRLLAVTDPQGGTTSYTYDAEGRRTALAHPNGVVVEYEYDELDRLIGLTQRRNAITLASYEYTLDPAGNRQSVIELDGSSIEWTYDAAYRLLSETLRGPSSTVISESSYSYDAVGNRLTQTVAGLTTTYNYNVLNQVVSAGPMNFSYDTRGNLIQTMDGVDLTAFTWDARDRLTDVTIPDGTAIAYGYDAAGRRVSQLVDGSEVNFLWDEISLYGDIILETDSFGAVLANYVLGGPELLSQTRDGSTYYYLTDALGSIRGLTDGAGAVSDTYDYTAFGELFASTGTTDNAYLFSSQQFDELTGQYYLRARYYQPGLGRFLSRDRIKVDQFNPIELNRYVYAANNPPNLSDPSGLLALEYTPTFANSVINLGGITLIGRVALVLFAVGYISLLLAGEIDAPDRVGPSPLPDYIEDRIGDIVTQAEAAEMARRLAELLETRPQPEPEPEEGPGPDIFPPIPGNEPNRCNPEAFALWWGGLPERGTLQPGVDWYDYEQRTARGPGTIGGDLPRTVPAGSKSIDADGAKSTGCSLLESKFSPDPSVTQFREGAPPWIIVQLSNEIRRYRLAINVPNGVPGAQPMSLEIITNLEASRAFFIGLLTTGGLTPGVDGFVRIVP